MTSVSFKDVYKSYIFTIWQLNSSKYRYVSLTVYLKISNLLGGACGVMVIVAEYGHGDASSNPGRDWLHFT